MDPLAIRLIDLQSRQVEVCAMFTKRESTFSASGSSRGKCSPGADLRKNLGL